MVYLSGAINAHVTESGRPDVGIMYTPDMGNHPEPLRRLLFALDNSCYSRGDAFDPARWLAWLETLVPYRERCLFAVAPDVVGDAEATLARSRPYLPLIRELGYPAAFVTQDGCTDALVPWGEIDALFVGGTNRWKLSEASWALVAEANRRGLHTHVGRVNSFTRIRVCAMAGVRSVDGTFLAFGPDANWPRLVRWLDALAVQPTLNLEAVS